MATVTQADSTSGLTDALAGLMAAYAHAIDDDRLEDWPGFFIEDGVYRVTTRENHELGLPGSIVACEGRGMLRDRISALRHANIFEPHVYCHIVGLPQIVDGRDGDVSARTNFIVVRTMAEGEMSVFACGRYLDRVADDGGVLRFRERVVVLDSRVVDTLLVIPI